MGFDLILMQGLYKPRISAKINEDSLEDVNANLILTGICSNKRDILRYLFHNLTSTLVHISKGNIKWDGLLVSNCKWKKQKAEPCDVKQATLQGRHRYKQNILSPVCGVEVP